MITKGKRHADTNSVFDREKDRETERGSLGKFADENGVVQDSKGWISGGWRRQSSRPPV